MRDHAEFISHWINIAHESQALLDLAQEGEWDKILNQEENYLDNFETVLQELPQNISQSEQNTIENCLKKILENEAILKILLQQRLDKLSLLIKQSIRQRSVNTAYGSISGMVLLPEAKLDTATITKR